RHAPVRAGEAPLPQSRADPADPRPVDRQIQGAPHLGAPRPQDATGGERMTTTTEIQTTQVYQVFIKATPEAIWEAITKPEFTQKYFYGARIENTAERHHSLGPDGSLWGDSATFEFEPPRRLVHGWRSLYSPEFA